MFEILLLIFIVSLKITLAQSERQFNIETMFHIESIDRVLGGERLENYYIYRKSRKPFSGFLLDDAYGQFENFLVLQVKDGWLDSLSFSYVKGRLNYHIKTIALDRGNVPIEFIKFHYRGKKKGKIKEISKYSELPDKILWREIHYLNNGKYKVVDFSKKGNKMSKNKYILDSLEITHQSQIIINDMICFPMILLNKEDLFR